MNKLSDKYRKGRENTEGGMAEESRKGKSSSSSLLSDESRKGQLVSSFPKPSSDDRKGSSTPTPIPTLPLKKITIKSADMKDDMQKDAIESALGALEKHSVEKDIAEYIKKEFDKKYGATWHCIVGRNFGSYVTHETNHFVYFYVEQKAILLFKSG